VKNQPRKKKKRKKIERKRMKRVRYGKTSIEIELRGLVHSTYT